MERLMYLKQENQDKYLKSKEIRDINQSKRIKDEQVRREIRDLVRGPSASSASGGTKVRSVYTLIEKYTQ